MAYVGDIRLEDMSCCGVCFVIGARISSLFRTSGPLAIFWRIRTIVIYSLNRVIARWAFTHVGKKVCERIKPARANKNASPAPVCKVVAVGVVAALFDVAPRIPFRANAALPCHSVGCKPRRAQFSPKAPATDAAPVPQSRPINIFYRSAIANARPLSIARITCGSPSSEPFSSDVVEFWHASSLPHGGRFAWPI